MQFLVVVIDVIMTTDYLNEDICSQGGGLPSVAVFLTEPNPYLLEITKGSKKTTENTERLGRRTRLGYKPSSLVYQLRKHSSVVTGGANYLQETSFLAPPLIFQKLLYSCPVQAQYVHLHEYLLDFFKRGFAL